MITLKPLRKTCLPRIAQQNFNDITNTASAINYRRRVEGVDYISKQSQRDTCVFLVKLPYKCYGSYAKPTIGEV